MTIKDIPTKRKRASTSSTEKLEKSSLKKLNKKSKDKNNPGEWDETPKKLASAPPDETVTPLCGKKKKNRKENLSESPNESGDEKQIRLTSVKKSKKSRHQSIDGLEVDTISSSPTKKSKNNKTELESNVENVELGTLSQKKKAKKSDGIERVKQNSHSKEKRKKVAERNDNNVTVDECDEMDIVENTKKVKKHKKRKTEKSEIQNDEDADETENLARKKNKVNVANRSSPSEETIEPESGEIESNKLFVGNLSGETTEEDLKQQFPSACTVQIHTKKKGIRFAFLEFENAEEAERNVKNFTELELKGRKLSVDFVRKTYTNKNTGKQDLYVGNLPKDIREKQIKAHFPGSSNVRLRRDKKGNAFAFVEFKNETDAMITLDEKQGTKIRDMEVNITSVSKEAAQHDQKERTLVVSNLAKSTTETDLRNHFTGVSSINMPRGTDGWIKGTAYIMFSSKEQVISVIESKQQLRLNGKRLRLSCAAKRKKKTKGKEKYSRTLMVENVSLSSTELKKLFPGSVHVKIPQLKDGRPKKFAFIEFKTEEDADNVMQNKSKKLKSKKGMELNYVGEKRKLQKKIGEA